MITELGIENFKSFGSDMLALHLRPLNFSVGANASGKTNLLSALRFLEIALLQNTEISVAEFEGPGEVRNTIQRERKESKPVRLRLMVDGVKAPADTSSVAKGRLRFLLKTHTGRNFGFNEIDFAKTIAPKFQPNRAPLHSTSLRYFGDIVELKARRSSNAC